MLSQLKKSHKIKAAARLDGGSPRSAEPLRLYPGSVCVRGVSWGAGTSGVSQRVERTQSLQFPATVLGGHGRAGPRGLSWSSASAAAGPFAAERGERPGGSRTHRAGLLACRVVLTKLPRSLSSLPQPW